MDPAAAKYIGAGLATLGMIGAGIGVGNIFGSFLTGALRNPSAAASQQTCSHASHRTAADIADSLLLGCVSCSSAHGRLEIG